MYFEALASGGDDWYNIVLITAPEGASITFDDGDEEVIVTGTGMQYPVPLHNDSSTYSITVDANGFVQTDSVTTSAVSGTVFTKKISYAKIILTFDDAFRGQNFNITDGSISPSTPQAFPSTGNTIDLYVPNTGTWKTSSSAAGESYESKGATVTDIDGVYRDELHTRPDGKTATPTDVIQTWLECAGIRNKSYTTLAEVLADKETLQTLISDENAVDYMVRSKSWAMGNLVPTMTSDTLPEGIAFSRSEGTGNEAFRAFDYDGTTSAKSSGLESTAGWYLGYIFDTPKKINYLTCVGETGYQITWKVQVSNDTTNGTDGTWYDRPNSTFNTSTAIGQVKVALDIPTVVKAIRIVSTAVGGATYFTISKLEFNDEASLTNDSTAMRYIGLRNYASDTLLDDADWCEAICNSEYFESVLNVKVPAMTDDTHPSGVVTASSEYGGYEKYKAFDGKINEDLYTSNHGWWTASGSHATGNYIRYEFPSSKFIKKALIKWSNSQVSKVKLQGSPNGTDWTDLTDELTLLGNSSYNSQDLWLNFVDNDDEFKYYQMIFTAGGNHGGYGYKLQFYGREDVDESVIHIYSAASDNDIHYLSGSTPVTVASTDPDGHGTIARTLLPAGTYDLYSSVAMDPDGNMSTEYFHKEVTVKADTIEIMLMPVDCVDMAYWYGYKNNVGSMAVVAPALSYTAAVNIDANTHYVATSGAGGIITPKPVNGKIAKAVVSNWSGGPSESVDVWSGLTVYPDPKLVSTTDRDSSTHLMTANTFGRTMDHRYISAHTTSGSSGSSSTRIYALWAEGKNPLANFFSAANDQVYYISGGVHVPVVKTNSLGEAVVDLSSIPTGVELYSSVAMDPDGDMSTQYYHKTFALDADGKFRLMPEHALYWYGWISNNVEEFSVANGWSWPNNGFVAPVYSLNSVYFSGGGTPLSGLSTKDKGYTNVTAKAIASSSAINANVGFSMKRLNSKAFDNQGSSTIDESDQSVLNTIQLISLTCTTTDGYLLTHGGYSRNATMYGWWYE